MGIKDIYT